MSEKTYIVNMMKDVDKKRVIESHLASHNELDWKFWQAVEGRKLTAQQQTAMILPEFAARYGRNATLPAAGCSLSHINIYRDIVANGINHALILEDDARLKPNLHIESIKHILETDSPVVVLLTPEFWYSANVVSMISKQHGVFQVYEGYMTSGYMINLAAAKLLLKYIYPVQYTADAWKIFISFGLKVYGVVPHVISYPEGLGEIGISQVVKQEPLFLKLRHFCGRQKAKLYYLMLRFKGYKHSSRIW